MKTCPFCREEIPQDASVCPICNEKLSTQKTKVCPFCKEEILSSSKVCPVCGEKLAEHIKININKKILRITLSVFVAIVLLVFGCERYLRWESSYMQKIPYHEYVESYENNMTALETLEKINQQTNSLEKYLKGLHLPHFKEKAFLRYYENLKYYTEVLDYNLSVGMWDFGSIAGISTINVNGVLVSASVTREMHDGYPTTQINEPFIEKPMTKTIKLVYSGEGMYSPVINYVYLNDEYYSKHLTTRSQKYLAIRAKQQEDLGGATYYIDGALNVTRLKLIDWIGEFQKFLSKYKGNDYLNSCAKESLKTYVSDFMYSTYNTFDFSTNKLRPEAKAGYETFLEKINKNTKEYEVVKKAYDILKKNNYTESAEFFNYVKSYKQ